MYELTEYDKFNLKNLLIIKSDELSKEEFNEIFQGFLKLNNFELAEYINWIINSIDSPIINFRSTTQNETIDYCKKLIIKLFDDNQKNIPIKENKIDWIDYFSNIHSEIHSHIQKFFNDWHYATAVEEAYKFTRERLREITWKEKAHEAFKEWNYEIIFWKLPDSEAEKNFCEWVKFLHLAIQNFRNEKAHKIAWDLDKNRAIHYIYLASLALFLIDSIKKN